MKFSTLTKSDLVEAYENKSPHLDWGQAHAGETRHFLDFFYGINLSRALTAAITQAGFFKILSIGRVQGPSLKIVVEREQEIKAFKPEPFWQLELKGTTQAGQIIAWHQKDKFWKKEEAEDVLKKTTKDNKIKSKNYHQAAIENIEKKRFNQSPPFPFDLTSLQTEAYRCFGLSPKRTLQLAQNLYTAGYISYPRTSSQKLPPKLGYKKILEKLKKQPIYKELAEKLLRQKTLAPNEGKKTDPAHPAIYPTGIVPKSLDSQNKKIYDLITKRFLATFGPPAKRETAVVKTNCQDEIFITKGTRTIEPGWHLLYQPYVKLKEEELPNYQQGDTVKVKDIKMHQKETQPPKRYTESSLIKELEKKNLGTKATRAQIIDTLYQRNYIKDKKIKATDFGVKIIETLKKHSPLIIDEKLTKHFEEALEKIREQKEKPAKVLDEAKEIILKISDKFKKDEKEIGQALVGTYKESERKASTVSKCPHCGSDLRVRRGKFGQFIACSNYPDCKTTFSLPKGLVKSTDKLCPECNWPLIQIIRKGKRPQNVCFNPDCPTKKLTKQEKKMEKKCPKCSAPMVLRQSVYGKFWGCSKYPKCKTIVPYGDKGDKKSKGKNNWNKGNKKSSWKSKNKKDKKKKK